MKNLSKDTDLEYIIEEDVYDLIIINKPYRR